MTLTAQVLQKIWRAEERMTDEMGLQTFPKQTRMTPTWRFFCDTSFPKPGSSNR